MTRNPAKIRLSGQSGVYKTVYTDMDQYLKQRQDGKSETYYLTYPVPTELQELVGRRYERKSTGTTNLRDARRVAAELVALYERKYQLLYAQITSTEHDVKKPKSTAISATLSEKLISTLCEAWRATHLKSDDRERDEGIDSTDLEDIQAYARAIEIDARELLALGRNAASFAHVCEEACDWAETLGYLIAQNDPSIAIYIRKFAAEKFEVAKALVARNKGEPVLTPDLPAHFKGLTLAEYKPHWLGVHIKGLAQKTKVGYSGRVDQFIRFLNLKFPELDNAPLRAIEGRHIQAYASYLLNDEELHPGTIVDGHLPAIRSCFQYAFSDGHTIANPCMNVKLSKISKKVEAERARPREAFEATFLNKLFASSWYGIGEEGLLRGPVYADLYTRYWVPLIMMCHGIRPIEVCQLTINDIFYSENILSIAIASDEAGKSTKTKATRRGLPIHAKLIELEFTEFCERRLKEGKPKDRLFPTMEGRKDPAKWFTQQFNRYIRNFLNAPLTYTPHGFRHYWEDCRRAAQAIYGKAAWPPGMHFQLSGRSAIEIEEGSAKDYGNKYTAAQMQPYLNLIWNKDIVLPMKFTEFESKAHVPAEARVAFNEFKAEVKNNSKKKSR